MTFFTSCPSYNLRPGTGLLAENSAGGARLQTRRLRGRIRDGILEIRVIFVLNSLSIYIAWYLEQNTHINVPIRPKLLR